MSNNTFLAYRCPFYDECHEQKDEFYADDTMMESIEPPKKCKLKRVLTVKRKRVCGITAKFEPGKGTQQQFDTLASLKVLPWWMAKR